MASQKSRNDEVALPLQDDAIAATGLIHRNGGVDQMGPGHSATLVDYITPNSRENVNLRQGQSAPSPKRLIGNKPFSDQNTSFWWCQQNFSQRPYDAETHSDDNT
jgi:hypothetical protein